MKRWIVFSVASVVVSLVAPVAMSAATTGSEIGWLRHSGELRAGHATLLRLVRGERSVCTLDLRSPSKKVMQWTYGASKGTAEFYVHAPTDVQGGRWRFSARCVAIGTTNSHVATTSLEVVNQRQGRAPLVGRRGPLYEVLLPKGRLQPIKATVLLGGKGGDPGNDYPAQWRNAPQDSLFDTWREYNRECTSFVAWALFSRNGFSMPFYDNAINWGYDASRRGFAVNATPSVGSVAWSARSPFGHVAWVAAVGNGVVTIEEYNYWGNGTYDERTVPVSTFTGYIHFDDLPAYVPPASPPTTVATTTTTTPPPPVQLPPPVATTTTSLPVATTTTTTTPPPPPTWAETTGGVAHTWTDYTNAGGTAGPIINSNETVQITCRTSGFQVSDGNTWWYKIASSPWNNQFWVSADAFYNNGQTAGSLIGTPFVDTSVATC